MIGFIGSLRTRAERPA